MGLYSQSPPSIWSPYRWEVDCNIHFYGKEEAEKALVRGASEAGIFEEKKGVQGHFNNFWRGIFRKKLALSKKSDKQALEVLSMLPPKVQMDIATFHRYWMDRQQTFVWNNDLADIFATMVSQTGGYLGLPQRLMSSIKISKRRIRSF